MWLSILLFGAIGILLLIAKVVKSRSNIEIPAATIKAKSDKIRQLPPGPKPTDSQHGNHPDMVAAGGMHDYLMSLHEKYGKIVSFHLGRHLCVSIGSAELLKEHTKLTNRKPDRPLQIMQGFVPLMGDTCIGFAQGDVWRVRKQRYDKFFTANAVEDYYTVFQQAVDNAVLKLSHLPPEEHIPVTDTMLSITLHGAAHNLFGATHNIDNYLRTCAPVMMEAERSFSEGQLPAKSHDQNQFDQDVATMWETIRSITEHYHTDRQDGKELLIDCIKKNAETEQQVHSDVANFLVGGMHTTGHLLIWTVYLLSSHPDIQEKAIKELDDVLGEDNVVPSNLPLLQYMRQILDEAMRWSNLSFAMRQSDEDITLGGYTVPGKTPVIQSPGVMNSDPEIFPEPTKFDPDRFSPEKVKTMPPYAFEPFGAGKRKCIGHRYAYAEATIVVATLLRKFRFMLVEGYCHDPVYGPVTRPRDEVWVTIKKRH